MRYGLVREGSDLPPTEQQRRLLEAAACDLVHEARSTRPDQNSLKSLLAQLKPGDEIVAPSLDAFQLSTGELALLLRRLFELRVGVHVVQSTGALERLNPAGGIPKLLHLLADHEVRRPSRVPWKRSRANLKALSVHQIGYARALLKKGDSLRSVGLLFQLTPNELLKELGS